MTKSVPTPNTPNPEPRARAEKKRRTPSAHARRPKLSQKQLRRRGPPKIPGAEVFNELRLELSKVEQRAISGEFDGRPDLVIEAFIHLNDLSRIAYETFFELHRETCESVWTLNQHALSLDEIVKAFWSELWKKESQK